eukprot:gnl/MRDRNA2_/MRDRNA2_168426_c0_seq1.p1 gnl/MRDRNA2_/MRDRNA2_168426_c0~~gnl/MRDRNA2_/MRDRNA2_168426_c0_seq1.p1  ORF type:complete len:450 (+),score=80.43 gnl/MRDRNA2_/MRDRNA2_168426_c0_seq1:74-1351(+)
MPPGRGSAIQCYPDLQILSFEQIADLCRRGKRLVWVDNTVLDVGPLIDDADGAHKGGNVFSIGRDNTHLFRELHANLPVMPSKHRPELPSVTAHILEKVQKIAVGVLKGREREVPLIDPKHQFWVPTERKPPMIEEVKTSLRAMGRDAAAEAMAAVSQLRPGSPEYRAFWAVVGMLVADAAAQPTHWNYKVTYYQDALKQAGRWDAPEFITPSMNAYYHVPLGSHSCFGDQAVQVLKSLVHSGGVEISDLIKRHVDKFGPKGEYGALGRHDGASGGELPIKGPWRHGSIATFLKNVQRGVPYPDCGANDGSSDCFVKVVPVVALYAGDPQLLDRVAEVCRMTQNNRHAVAFACAAARILESIILDGVCGAEAVSLAVGDMKQSQSNRLEKEVASLIQQTAQLQQFEYLDGVIAYCGGRYNAIHVS